jgi:hypothetical protein
MWLGTPTIIRYRYRRAENVGKISVGGQVHHHQHMVELVHWH